MKNKKESTIKLPQPINLRYKCVQGFFGRKKIVPTSLSEQKRLKKKIQKIFPDNLFYDDLNDESSLEAVDSESSINVWDKPISLRYRYKRNIFGKRIQVETSYDEQRKLKKAFMKVFPDSLFYDDLRENNSVKIKRKNSYGLSDFASDFFSYKIAEDIIESFDDDDCDCGCDCDNDSFDCDANDCGCDD